MNKAYRFRIYPTPTQETMIRKTFGCVRFLYNQMLAERKAPSEWDRTDAERPKRQKFRTPAAFKTEFPWLREVDSLALCNAELNLKSAFRHFFRDKRTGYPKFKSRKNPVQSYTTNNQKGTIRLEAGGKHVRIPKLGEIRIKLHRHIPESHTIKSATISRSSSGKYHISILTYYETEEKPIFPHPDKVLGLDYSSKALYIDHRNTSADYPKYLRNMEIRLKNEQRVLSRRKTGGSNWRKQKLRIARLHEKVANQRKDFLHKVSKQLAETWEAIVVEDLNMKAMSQSLSLGKATMDNGNGLFRTFLGYKLADRGKRLVRIDKWFPSSKRCGACSKINKLLTLKERVWVCEGCGRIHLRDANAAGNIRAEGLRMLGLA
ncbi:RNA-guided endonuclease TnpB family protein [Paenibacillus ginsengarvi]|uniref:Transposase n=1 Tax=Paenibacillus ginsengarvi TaxID=400777 RepID=A0A3B0BKJ3_9BACL|nr:RNA-guided endonuclease TnpB family protein [Paenibacillus ginsengarvi]RKN73010.1 transposase [Paenibacillus ginsengarvi]